MWRLACGTSGSLTLVGESMKWPSTLSRIAFLWDSTFHHEWMRDSTLLGEGSSLVVPLGLLYWSLQHCWDVFMSETFVLLKAVWGISEDTISTSKINKAQDFKSLHAFTEKDTPTMRWNESWPSFPLLQLFKTETEKFDRRGRATPNHAQHIMCVTMCYKSTPSGIHTLSSHQEFP